MMLLFWPADVQFAPAPFLEKALPLPLHCSCSLKQKIVGRGAQLGTFVWICFWLPWCVPLSYMHDLSECSTGGYLITPFYRGEAGSVHPLGQGHSSRKCQSWDRNPGPRDSGERKLTRARPVLPKDSELILQIRVKYVVPPIVPVPQ